MSTALLQPEQDKLPGRGGLLGAMAAEWTKLRTVRSTWLNLVSATLLTALMSLQLGLQPAYEAEHLPPGAVAEQVPVGQIAINAGLIVQIVITALAMLTITSEYSTGSIHSTLQWTPVRRNVLLAKAIVLTPVIFVLGLLQGGIAAIVGDVTMGRWALLDGAELAVDLLAVALYVTLASLFVLGIGVLIRSAAGTLTAAFLLLIMVPLMLGQSGIRILVWTGALLPGGAGQNFLKADGPLDPTASLGVLAAWTVASLWLGVKVLQRRDA